MAESLREVITESDTLASLCEALQDHGIAPDKIVSVLRIEAQLIGYPKPPRLRVLYREASTT